MKILVTGSKGFIGKNLIAELRNRGYSNILEFTSDSDPSLLEQHVMECEFVYHLAGVNRPKDPSEFVKGNYELTEKLIQLLKKYNNRAPILLTSSIQAELDSPYGISKKGAEELLSNHYKESDSKVYVYRLPGVFGKWSKPNYNTVVATYCHNIANGLDIKINNPEAKLSLCYIDDVIDEFIRVMNEPPIYRDDYCIVPTEHTIKLSELARLIMSFKESRTDLSVPNLQDSLTKKLYSTYLSFLPEDQFVYDLKMNVDHRGSFTEFIKTDERGQVSVNVSKPGIIKGNHWHHTKNEKFMVVSGEGLIRFRKIGSEKIIEYSVSGDRLQVVDIPVGYTHSIVNVGENDLVTVMWANECFDPKKPDTFFLEV